MATTQHYVWAAGHAILLVSAIRYLLPSLMFKSVSSWWYKTAFAGALMSYAIVCIKSLGAPQPNPTYFKRAFLDENVQYLGLAFFWWSSKPVAVALLPYMIFSLFHALTFTRTTLMPQFFPPEPSSTPSGSPQIHPIAKRIQVWVKANYDPAMKAVAYIEIGIFVRVLLGAALMQNSLISPLVYALFLRQRYYQSAFTREAIGVANERIVRFVRRPGMPPVLEKVWDVVQMVSASFVGNTLAPQQGQS